MLSEELWTRLRPLIPARPRRDRYPGRLPADDRSALEGILWVLRHDVPWRDLPTPLFGVSGVTCWRRLRDWEEVGVWEKLRGILLAELDHADMHGLCQVLTSGPRRNRGRAAGRVLGQTVVDHWHDRSWRSSATMSPG